MNLLYFPCFIFSTSCSKQLPTILYSIFYINTVKTSPRPKKKTARKFIEGIIFIAVINLVEINLLLSILLLKKFTLPTLCNLPITTEYKMMHISSILWQTTEFKIYCFLNFCKFSTVSPFKYCSSSHTWTWMVHNSKNVTRQWSVTLETLTCTYY